MHSSSKEFSILHSLHQGKVNTHFSSQEISQFLDQTTSVSIKKTIKFIPKAYNRILKCNPIQFENATGVHYISHLHFDDEKQIKKVINNCPYLLRTSIGDEARNLAKQYNQQLSNGYVADIVIKWLSEDIGYGVFSEQDMPTGAYVGEYVGKVRRLYRTHPDQNSYCFHYPTRFWSWNYTVIDAMSEGNELRFVNHSSTPNLQPAYLLDRGILHLVLFAKREIKKGEQLTFNYGDDFWRHRMEQNL